ncbi:MAG: alpha-amylase [Candidatus Hydrogenedentes bacterium]|nr:alpha-amylase [Candidatus Hydrogenedentota bacterium]
MRRLADRLNAQRSVDQPGTRPARAGELLALDLLNEILRFILDSYCEDSFPGVMQRGLDWVRAQAGVDIADQPLPAFVELYPPGGLLPEEALHFLQQSTGKLNNREVVAREILLLALNNTNPAAAAYRPLFDDADLRLQCRYPSLTEHLDQWFERQPPVPKLELRLPAVLRAPLNASPDSLAGQLDYIRSFWRGLLPVEMLERLELTRSVLQEETRMRGLGVGPVEALHFGPGGAHGAPEAYGREEPEAFSIDKDWMPNVVLLAKTIYVWLHQLSRQYGREIQRLDQIPDEELDRLARWGISGLWLIGLWERSPASREIKQRMGNPEAAASAYSLFDYEVAADLGGHEAYSNLAGRAWRRGIRLASDMVPNHVGIYSRWVIEHPGWFIQLNYPPFPSYRFTGPNLSHDSRVALHLEDGYWDRRDAAVVFQRVDTWTGEVRYIYHGNDGTSMPWNDTAQLNFLLPEVREAVIQTILHVARQFRIIRFDAAMTLAKQHFQRLWYPKPGDGGAIPSRAEHGMSKAEFDHCFPLEFWREVVDRVAREAPDTLLLAEAFWLMEGYFVRTLGMHRVYNSAFMNMLKMEDNAKYRQTIKNVLEFSPEILQRFVNFMNNPDEDTAEAQFGRGDKYFGVAMLLATMPGLPMIGHGQVEGYTEKYGMEYRRAYRDEQADWGLVERHEREIFPLMRRRQLFSGARHFSLFDFVTPDGWVDENVFAFSNRFGEQRALIVYNNVYTSTRGVIQLSTAINEGSADNEVLRRRTLAEALGLNTADNAYYIFRDHRTGLEYLRHGPRLTSDGMYVELNGYQYHAFIEWREVLDYDQSWGRLHAFLGGMGVANIDEAYVELHLAPILDPFRGVINADTLKLLCDPAPTPGQRAAFQKAMQDFLNALGERLGNKPDVARILEHVDADLGRLHELAAGPSRDGLYKESLDFVRAGHEDAESLQDWRVALVWAIVRHLGAVALTPEDLANNGRKPDVTATSAAWLHEWFLLKQIARAFDALDPDPWRAEADARLVRICVAHGRHLLSLQTEIWGPVLEGLFGDADVQRYLQLNHFGGRRWINKEQLERMLYHVYLTLTANLLHEDSLAGEKLLLCLHDLQALLHAAEDNHYDFDAMLSCLK